MSGSAFRSVSDSNIQEKTTSSPCHQPPEEQILALARLLRSPHWLGRVLRVLVRRLVHPDRPYSEGELEVLLLVSVALQRAGMKP